MEIFKNNTYYFGLTIPDPGTTYPLEKRVTSEMAGPDGVKFMKVPHYATDKISKTV
jgi:hypothetical protein